MREDSVREYPKRAGEEWKVVTNLIESGSLREAEYQGKNFYLKKFPKKG